MTYDQVVEEHSEDLANLFVVLDGIKNLMFSNDVDYLPGGGARLVRADQRAAHEEPSATS